MSHRWPISFLQKAEMIIYKEKGREEAASSSPSMLLPLCSIFSIERVFCLVCSRNQTFSSLRFNSLYSLSLFLYLSLSVILLLLCCSYAGGYKIRLLEILKFEWNNHSLLFATVITFIHSLICNSNAMVAFPIQVRVLDWR